jgi:leucyl aminopeptidase (aminopeptidase T)
VLHRTAKSTAPVVDGVVGDFLCARYGILRAHPLTINIEANRITRVSSENKALERDFWAYTHTDENSDRVGEFAIGTNIGVERVIGNILQDEKFPGIHIAFGDPYGAHTGAPWKSSTRIDVVGLEFSIWLGDADGEEQIGDGQFLIRARNFSGPEIFLQPPLVISTEATAASSGSQ